MLEDSPAVGECGESASAGDQDLTVAATGSLIQFVLLPIWAVGVSRPPLEQLCMLLKVCDVKNGPPNSYK